jgi:hypothetical protein
MIELTLQLMYTVARTIGRAHTDDPIAVMLE